MKRDEKDDLREAVQGLNDRLAKVEHDRAPVPHTARHLTQEAYDGLRNQIDNLHTTLLYVYNPHSYYYILISLEGN